MKLRSAVLTTILVLEGNSIARGAAIYNVAIDTTPLIGHAAGPFAIELQFNDGSGTGDANNSAGLSKFDFGSGTATGSPSVVGGSTGDLSTSVTLVDSSFFNQFIQTFNPGAKLTFQLSLSSNVDAGTPDELSFAILDSSGFEIPTFGPANAFIVFDIDSGTPTPLTFASDPGVFPNAGGPPINVGPPTVESASTETPEPRTGALAIPGLLALLYARGSLRRVDKSSGIACLWPPKAFG